MVLHNKPVNYPKVYIKDKSFDPIYTPVNTKFLMRAKVYPLSLMFFGALVLVTQVLVPLFYLKTTDEISKPVSSSVLGVASGFRDFRFKELQNPYGTTTTLYSTSIPDYFYLGVPKLGIEDALVETNAPGLNPDNALGHYSGSALPGEVGNVFIYGHSVLPWFYNPRNYKSIFSTLDTLGVGDEFYLTYNGDRLKYKVDGYKVQHPDDVKPLADVRYKFLNESTVTLMTCVPPGTKLKRLLVTGVLVH